MEEASEQMFKGDPWMAQRLRNGVIFFQGHLHGEPCIVDGHVGGTTEFFMVLRQDLQQMEVEQPDPTDAGSTFCRNERTKVDSS